MTTPPEGAPVADEIMTMGEVSRTLARLDRRIEAGMALRSHTSPSQDMRRST